MFCMDQECARRVFQGGIMRGLPAMSAASVAYGERQTPARLVLSFPFLQELHDKFMLFLHSGTIECKRKTA